MISLSSAQTDTISFGHNPEQSNISSKENNLKLVMKTLSPVVLSPFQLSNYQIWSPNFVLLLIVQIQQHTVAS